jgi:hypothetical protein
MPAARRDAASAGRQFENRAAGGPVAAALFRHCRPDHPDITN